MPAPMHKPSDDRLLKSKGYRVVTAAFGLFFIALAVVIVVSSEESTRTGALLVAMLVGGLGLEALISATRNQRSWLSRIGPLP